MNGKESDWGGCGLAQESQTRGGERPGGRWILDYRDRVVRAGLLQTEIHCGEQQQHPATASCESVTGGLFPVPPGGDPERNYLKLLDALTGCGQPQPRETLGL